MEKRRFAREQVSISAKVFEVGDENSPLTLELSQLGQGGCLVKGEEFLGVGRVFGIALEFGETRSSQIGKVLYEFRGRESEVYSGLEFFDYDELPSATSGDLPLFATR